MDWIQTLTIIGTLGTLTIGLHIITNTNLNRRIDDLNIGLNRRIDDLADDMRAIREDIRLIMNKLIPNRKSKD